MRRCLEAVAYGAFDPAKIVDRVTLDLEGRRKRRQALTGAGGLTFLVDLPTVPSLMDRDGLRLENGEIVEVRAADEPLIEVRVNDISVLPRIAWHLGNRHLPVQFVDDVIRLRADHVIEGDAGETRCRGPSDQSPIRP